MKKILVANRGEIALRVMRTAKKMGIRTVAVYSTPDRYAPHVQFADEAICIGPGPSNQSYLNGQKIIDIAKAKEVDAIHPGYGFLSENAEFARSVNESGLIFIGPDPHSIEIMGSKLAAKEAVKKYNIPLVPGTNKPVQEINEAKRIAAEIGYPVLVKASAGGGGKGMRVVSMEKDLAEQMERAISEAISAFGDGSIFIEKYVTSPRHIEIQVLADRHGTILHFFERDCSIQRRHQKVIEEAPSAILPQEIREAMGTAAINVAKSCNYVSAGTVEFLLDDDLNYYFLEMNTRLQVEHPVTEIVTGVDLVEQQIRVARGEKLAIKQNELEIRGHAIELRVYAEDPYNNFLPSIGKLSKYRGPKGPGIRLDNGYLEGMEIPIFYDPMLAKLIGFGPTRNDAIQRLLDAIDDFEIEGVATTLPFCRFVLNHEAFVSGDFDTNFVSNYFSSSALANIQYGEETAEAISRFALWYYLEHQGKLKTVDPGNPDWWNNRKRG